MFDPVRSSLADSLVVHADELLQDHRVDSARSALRRALALEPNHAMGNALMGDIAVADGDIEAAVGYYRKALKANPNHVDYAVRLGDCLGKLAESAMSPHREWSGAARAYGYAKSLDPQRYETHVKEAACLGRIGEYRQALAVLDEAQQLEPGREEAYLDAARLWMRLGRRNQALGTCRRALSHVPQSVAIHNLTAAILVKTPGQEQVVPRPADRLAAADHLRRSLAIDATQPQIQALLRRIQAGGTPLASDHPAMD